MTPSQARNAIKKALTEILDPHPSKSQIKKMWAHFSSQCAFCDVELVKKERKGHSDHLISSSKGGCNGSVNRVLACSTCNGDLKLDHPWEAFLATSPGTEEQRKKRKERILDWIALHQEVKISPAALEELQKQTDCATAAFNSAVSALRQVRRT